MLEPSTNGDHEDRDAAGRFVTGNRGGPGNPHARRVAEFRAAMLAAVTPEDVRAVVRALVLAATMGNVAAAREVLERVCGRVPLAEPLTPDEPPRIQLYGRDAPIDDV